MASGEDDQSGSEKVWDILRRVLPRFIRALMRYARITTQAGLADKTGISTSQINRYFHGKEFPDRNLTRLTEPFGLSEDSTWWFFFHTAAEEFSYARFKIPQPDEVREPQTPYRLERDLLKDLAMIMALDLDRLEPEDRVRLARRRNALRDQAKSLETLFDVLLEDYHCSVRRGRS